MYVDESQKQRHDTHKQHPAYRAFLLSLKSNITKQLYSHYLDKHYLDRPENKNISLSQILSKSSKEIEYELLGIVEEMRAAELSYSSITLAITAISHFFEINDVVLNKKKINRFKGENVNKFEYRAYTHDEISTLLNCLNERDRAAILLMASTGMRVGALSELKIKHLKKWTISHLSHYHVYQITVYASSPRDRYYTFCTPEAARAVDNYLDLRKRYGDSLDQDSYLFIRLFNKDDTYRTITDKRVLRPDNLMRIVIKALLSSGLRKTNKIPTTNLEYSEIRSLSSKTRHEIHPCHSLRIFAVTNMQRAKVDKTIREMLVGHTTGLDSQYYKPQEEEILEEYLKAVDNLTISNEYRLKRQVDYYKNRADVVDLLAAKLKTIEDKLSH